MFLFLLSYVAFNLLHNPLELSYKLSMGQCFLSCGCSLVLCTHRRKLEVCLEMKSDLVFTIIYNVYYSWFVILYCEPLRAPPKQVEFFIFHLMGYLFISALTYLSLHKRLTPVWICGAMVAHLTLSEGYVFGSRLIL